MVIKLKPLIANILIVLGIGGLAGFLTRNSMDVYSDIVKPAFSPPGFIFPIVWTILYILMGISAYMIYTSKSDDKKAALTVYGIQLVFNFFWSIIFFNFEAYTFAFVWIIILWILIAIMIYMFYQIEPKAAYLQIPYFLWVTFAAILNLVIVRLN